MRKFVTTLALASSLASLLAAAPAAAAQHHQQLRSYEVRGAGPGYYDGDREYWIDRNDHASSPYAGGVG